MPLVTIWRDPDKVDRYALLKLRNLLYRAVTEAFRVKDGVVEVRVRDVNPVLDLNYKPIGIEVDAGSGKDDWRITERENIAKSIDKQIRELGVLQSSWLGPEGSYIWVRIFYSSFLPIGHPELAK